MPDEPVLEAAMTHTLASYPAVLDVATRMALDNDMINRHHPESDFHALCDRAISNNGWRSDELQALEEWIQPLTDEDRDTLADGEESEVDALTSQAPARREPLVGSVADLFNDIFEEPDL
jgi:hypothetical protein